MDLKSFTSRYVYITDKASYYDRHRKQYVAGDAMMAKVLRLVGSTNEKEAATFLDSIKEAGLPLDEFRPAKDGAKASFQALLDELYETLSPKLPYYKHFDGLTTVLYTKSESNEVSYSGSCDEDQFKVLVSASAQVTRSLREVFNGEPEVRSKLGFVDFVREVYKRFEFDSEKTLDKPPALLSWSASEPAFRVLDPAILQPGSTATWEEFLNRMDYPETFKAYIWSIFEPANFGRQAMWIQGEGNDGKSTVLRVLSNFLGNKHTMTIGIGSYDSDFFFGQCFGKRLAIYSDCKNLQVLRKERIKSVLGKDIVSINNKYEKAFSAQVYCKLLVGSNWLPQINYSDSSERTRLLLVRMDKYSEVDGSGDFEDNLMTEVGAFLYSCRESYAQQCPKGVNLKVPAEMTNTIKTLCNAMDSILLEQFVAERLQFGDGLKVRQSDLFSKMKEYFMDHSATKESGFSFNDLLRLLSQKGIVPHAQETNVLVGVALKVDVSGA